MVQAPPPPHAPSTTSWSPSPAAQGREGGLNPPDLTQRHACTLPQKGGVLEKAVWLRTRASETNDKSAQARTALWNGLTI